MDSKDESGSLNVGVKFWAAHGRSRGLYPFFGGVSETKGDRLLKLIPTDNYCRSHPADRFTYHQDMQLQ
ncbi:hypothetical protein QUB63_25380 [Microcoleus sp. ARI1-B5]|uniref:hypothetical protein n=1 Tax=unclassified Microcoleus TaxID=2642155 RepID=UPI002FCFD2E1